MNKPKEKRYRLTVNENTYDVNGGVPQNYGSDEVPWYRDDVENQFYYFDQRGGGLFKFETTEGKMYISPNTPFTIMELKD